MRPLTHLESVTSRSETCVFARTKRSPLAESGRAMAVVVIMPRQMLVSEAVSDLGRLTPAFSLRRGEACVSRGGHTCEVVA